MTDPNTLHAASSVTELMLRASRTMFDGTFPENEVQWWMVINWLGLNMEAAEKAHRTADIILFLYQPGLDRAKVHTIIDYQRGERRRMGIDQ